MADLTEVRVMSLEELRNNPPLFDKKFLLINSSLYTDEAFEYLLELINETDCIAFIRDLKKIYTHGEFFGGDVWEEDLLCWGAFQLLDENDDIITELAAEELNDKIRFKSNNNITLTAEEYYVHGEKLKTIVIGYDINNSVDTSIFTVDDSTAQFNLEVNEGKIGINKYVPISVSVSGDTTPIEFDNAPDRIQFFLDVKGTAQNKNIYVTTGTNETVQIADDYSSVSATITPNTNVNYLVIYSDGQNEGSVMFEKKFGYGLFYSTEQITKDNIHDMNRVVVLNSCKCNITLDQGDENYGWFACPSNCKPIFKDTYSGICGGWTKVGKFRIYSNNIEYDVWRTENSGLGENNWEINEK